MIINSTDTLKHAWTGGVNNPVWGQLNLNDDRFPDLVLFDSYDNSFIPFINQGGDKPTYQYAPAYLKAFKDCKCEYWARFKDYDHDGDMDIFCSNNSDVSIYTNKPKNGEAYFELEVASLNAIYYRNDVFNLLSSKVFLPDLEDVDGDGDLDFLTWPLLINAPEIYINIGVDSFNNPDTVVYKLGQTCWGHFAENGLSGLITVRDTIGCPLGDFDPVANGCYDKGGKWDPTGSQVMEKHLGGTNLLIDMDGDQIFDLMTGDLGQANISYLHNCGDTGLCLYGYRDLQFFPPMTRRLICFKMWVLPILILTVMTSAT
ncbi:MAG: VCBS repeat-containing protein [Bacteroidia bacterium]